jgi:hypothetical protein
MAATATARTDEAIRPAAGREVLFAVFFGSELALELPQGLGKWRPSITTLSVKESEDA